MPKRNFVILIGGPGLYFACDPMHDKTWSNYIVPMQLAAEKKLYKIDNEKVHWLVFAPAYRKRWSDDITISKSEKKEFGLFGRDRYSNDRELYKPDTWLHKHRQQTAEKVRAKRGPRGALATSYLVRITQICIQHGIIYKPIENTGAFWTYLGNLANGSISRIWYCGHASPEGLMLDLDHDVPATQCGAFSENAISLNDIQTYSQVIAPKIDTDTDKPSEFYGCYTIDFAQKWNQQFAVATEGAENKITFQAIYKGNPSLNVLERIKRQPTVDGPPNWQKTQKPEQVEN